MRNEGALRVRDVRRTGMRLFGTERSLESRPRDRARHSCCLAVSAAQMKQSQKCRAKKLKRVGSLSSRSRTAVGRHLPEPEASSLAFRLVCRFL